MNDEKQGTGQLIEILKLLRTPLIIGKISIAWFDNCGGKNICLFWHENVFHISQRGNKLTAFNQNKVCDV